MISMRIAVLFVLWAGVAIISPAHAQSMMANVVTTCGTPNSTPVAGGPYPLTIDLTGSLCGSGGSPSSPGSFVVVPSGNASTGIVPVVAGPSASSAVLKASPGNFYGLTVTPTSNVYVFLINATSLPANATLTPGTASGNLQECLGVVPANLTSTFTFDSGPTEVFSTGITVALSSTACPVLTASAVGTINGRAN